VSSSGDGAGPVRGGQAELGPVAVLLPVKAFTEAKLRLAPALDPPHRAALARAMATHVVESAAPLPTAVVCDDAEVASWARDLGALVVWEPERGLNRAVEAGVARLAAGGARRVIVAHADLPQAGRLGWVARFAGVTVVPDHDDNGTNVICVPAGAGFTFSYGPGSFARHAAEAHRLGLALRVVREPSLSHDVDLPSDLAAFFELAGR
jgi:2-phospho-L-lactate guanylyltransferase